MITPEKIAQIKLDATLRGFDPDAAVDVYKNALIEEQQAYRKIVLEQWKKLGS